MGGRFGRAFRGGSRAAALAVLTAVALLPPGLVGGEEVAAPVLGAAPVAEEGSCGPLIRPNRARAKACWNQVATLVLDDQRQADLARRAVDRLLGTAHGVWLTEQLCTVLRDPSSGELASRVQVHFVRTLPEGTGDGAGLFRPIGPHAKRYELYVRTEAEDLDPAEVVYGEYPANPDCRVLFLFRLPESWMADSLYHELLHVWFVHAREGEMLRYPTGHGDAEECEFDRDFLLLLDSFARELAALEGQEPKRLIPFMDTQRSRRE